MKKGLSHRFSIKDGKFSLSTGPDKVRDNLLFLMYFDKVPRIYLHDFSPGVLWILQRPTSTVNNFRTIILAKLKKVVMKYVLEIAIDNIHLNQLRNEDSKKFELIFDYRYYNENGLLEEDTAVKFI
jgi:hypothetical protein